jgi:hypothetical protein
MQVCGLEDHEACELSEAEAAADLFFILTCNLDSKYPLDDDDTPLRQHTLAGALVLKGLDAKLLCGPVRNPMPNYSAEFVAAHNPVRRASLTFIASLFACSKCRQTIGGHFAATLLSHSS